MDVQAAASEAESAGPRPVIALVDDDRNILTTVSIALQAEGFATRLYSDGEAALAALLENPPDMAVFDRVLAIVRPFGWHVVLHLDAPDIAELAPMIERLPMTKVIDHMGRAPAKAGIDQEPFRILLGLARREDVWVKVSGAERIADPPFTAAVPFARALMEVAPDRVLWGTDFPHPNLKHEVDEADLVDLLADYGDADALHQLLVTNPARLYGFA